MTKRKIIQQLKEKLNATSHWFKPFDVTFTKADITYHVKIISASKSNLITVNSITRWDIKSGTLNGIRFKTLSVNPLQLKEFVFLQNPIIIFTNQPYQVLKYINESEVVNVSEKKEIHGIPIFYDVEKCIQTYTM